MKQTLSILFLCLFTLGACVNHSTPDLSPLSQQERDGRSALLNNSLDKNNLTKKIKTKDVSGTSSYGHDFLHGFSMKNEIAKIKNGDYSSPLLSFIIYQNDSFYHLSYTACVGSGNSQDSCYSIAGDINTGYGFCLAGGRTREECSPALGGINTGFGLCMASGRSSLECSSALGNINIGFGLCMAGGRDYSQCNPAIGDLNMGFGLCMAGGRNVYECVPALGSINIGFGLCMAGDRSSLECSKSLGNLNIGFGLCMTTDLPAANCNPFLGKMAIGFGLCVARTKDVSRCLNNAPNDFDIGIGLCIGAGRSESECSYAGSDPSTGFGLCMASGKAFSACQPSAGYPNIGFGLCMASTGNLLACRESMKSINTGFGFCMAGGRSSYECKDSLGRENLGFGVCMLTGTSLDDCKTAMSPTPIIDTSDFIFTYEGKISSISNNYFIDSHKPVKIDLRLDVNNLDVSKVADIFVVVRYVGDGQPEFFYQKIDSGFYTWDKNFATLFPAYPNQTLKASQQTTIFEGKLEGLKGVFELFYGYRIKGAATDDIYYNKDHVFIFRVF